MLGHFNAWIIFKSDEDSANICFILQVFSNFDQMLQLKNLPIIRFFDGGSSLFEKLKHLVVVKDQVHPSNFDPIILVEYCKLVPNPSPHLLTPRRVFLGWVVERFFEYFVLFWWDLEKKGVVCERNYFFVLVLREIQSVFPADYWEKHNHDSRDDLYEDVEAGGVIFVR